jgi:hypothetical protein
MTEPFEHALSRTFHPHFHLVEIKFMHTAATDWRDGTSCKKGDLQRGLVWDLESSAVQETPHA